MAGADAFAASVAKVIEGIREEAPGISLHGIAAKLTERGVKTARDGAWAATAVRNVLIRPSRPRSSPTWSNRAKVGSN